MRVKVKIRGLKQLRQNLDRVADSVAGAALEDAVKAAAEVIRSDASRRAPHRTGRLRIHVVIGDPQREGDGVKVKVGPDKEGFYGMFQEFGTRHHPPQPFLRPAFDNRREAAVNAAKTRIERALRRAAKG